MTNISISIFNIQTLPDISENSKKVEHTRHIHVGIPTRQPLMIEIVDKTFICVSFQIDCEPFH